MGSLYGPSYAIIDGSTGQQVAWLNQQTTDLLASAARAATTQSGDLTNYQYRGVTVELFMSAASSSGTVSLTIQGKTPGGLYYTLLATTLHSSASVGQPIIATVYPGIAASATGNVAASAVLPYGWRALVTHATTVLYTYAVHYQLLK